MGIALTTASCAENWIKEKIMNDISTKEIYEKSVQHFLAPIQSLQADPDVSEIMINGYDTIYFEKKGAIQKSDCKFDSPEALMAAAQNVAEFVNRNIGGQYHSLDARLPDGSRVHVIIPPCSRQGVCISIRRFKKTAFTLQNLIEWNSINDEVAEFLNIIVKLHKNTVVAGGTGTGKTTFLNALSSEIPETERIIVIEDSSELQLQQPHSLYLEAQPPQPDGTGEVTIRDLFVDSLRMRPDRIVVGEVRRGEALDLIQSMLSGHSGSLTTVHASTPESAAIRLETLCLMSDVVLPVYVARTQVGSALDLVIQLDRLSDHSRRMVAISECQGLNAADNTYIFNPLYKFKKTGKDENGKIQGKLEWTGNLPSFSQEPHAMGIDELIDLTSKVFPNKD